MMPIITDLQQKQDDKLVEIHCILCAADCIQAAMETDELDRSVYLDALHAVREGLRRTYDELHVLLCEGKVSA